MTKPPPETPAPGSAAPKAPAVPVGADRRQAARRPLRVAAWIAFGKNPPAGVRTIDVSETGVGLALPINLPAGTVCTVGFDLPTKGGGKMTVKSEAKVAQSVLGADGFKVGLMLVSPSADIVAALQKYVKG